jgi:NADPH:quinone reductase-like Zn-dependent oxidoreductase
VTSSPATLVPALESSDERAEPSPIQKEVVVLLKCFGGPDAFELVEQPMPTAGVGEVRIRVLAASVQFTDILLRKGKYPGLHQKPPLVLGYDVVGEIDEVSARSVSQRRPRMAPAS